MTIEQGTNLANAGYITIDNTQASLEDPTAVLCTITDLGQAQLNSMLAAPPVAPGQVPAAAPAAAPAAVAPPVAAPATAAVVAPVAAPVVAKGVPIPAGGTFGSRSGSYPFDSMEIGDSFHIAVSAQNPKPWTKIAATVGNATKKSMVPANPPQKETVKKRQVVRDAEKNVIKDANGKKVFETITVEQDVMVATKKFIVRHAAANDALGAGARIFRVALDFAG